MQQHIRLAEQLSDGEVEVPIAVQVGPRGRYGTGSDGPRVRTDSGDDRRGEGAVSPQKD